MVGTNTVESVEKDIDERIVDDIAYATENSDSDLRLRAIISRMGSSGHFRRRWAGGGVGDVRFGTDFARRLTRHIDGGSAIGISLHAETVLSLLHRFAHCDELIDIREQLLDGTMVGCIAASEPTGGSDLSAVQTGAFPQPDGSWRISGRKKYVSLGSIADIAVVLARMGRADGTLTSRTAIFAVPMAHADVVRAHDKLGTHALTTVVVDFQDVEVAPTAMLGRGGLGVLNLNYGLSFERLAIAAQVVGGCAGALELAVEHARRRVQFGKKLIDHQYVAFRLAEIRSEIEVLSRAVDSVADNLMRSSMDQAAMSSIAALKLQASRSAERLISDTMQVFGGAAYLVNETPFGQAWNDVRVSRIGAGTDEMMLSIVADSLRGNPEAYDRLISISG